MSTRSQTFRLVVVLFSLFAVAGCVSSPVTDSPGGHGDGIPLTNTYWQLVRVASEAVPETGGRQAHVLFLDDGRVRGFSGCNEYRGDYRVEGENLLFDAMSRAREDCNDSLVEPMLFAAFAKTVGVNLEGTRLRLLGEEAEVLAVFEAVTPE